VCGSRQGASSRPTQHVGAGEGSTVKRYNFTESAKTDNGTAFAKYQVLSAVAAAAVADAVVVD